MYRLYIDETGNADLKASRDPNHRYLSLTGIIMRLEYARQYAYPNLEEIKARFFGSHPDDPIILHRKDIIEKNRPFHSLRDSAVESEFNRVLLAYLRDLDFRVVTVVIDKLNHLERYKVWRQDPYHYCLAVLVERFVNMLRERGERGDVLAEVRGGKPDRRLEESFRRLYDIGTNNVRSGEMQAHLTSHKLKLKRKAENVTGLQIADMIANPSAMHIRSTHAAGNAPDRFGGQIVQILVDTKYRRSSRGQIEGYGTKWLFHKTGNGGP